LGRALSAGAEAEYVLAGDQALELRLGNARSEPLIIVNGVYAGQLGAEYIVVQPSVLRATAARRGWMPLGGVHSPQLSLGSDAAEECGFDLNAKVEGHHLDMCVTPTGALHVLQVAKTRSWMRMSQT
jgi:hypothetical protein